ncbi:hypothetical protein OIU84_028460 [Salix udensis]|uniref:BHLH domain-containing protein n=1 Tax=Salix udensis TaxID=889485 RepID=A0AAD6KER0_9ROSI|nr:hypothetical protein OIU84_028460 [Salix udensis]
MALVKDRMGSVQACSFYGNVMGDLSPLGPNYGFDEEGDHRNFEKNSGLMIKNLAMISPSPPSLGSDPSRENSGELVFQAAGNQVEEAHSLINFKGTGFDSIMQANGSLISFDQQSSRVSQTSSHHKDDYSAWEDLNSYQRASSFNSITSSAEKENHGDWLYTESTILTDSNPDSAAPDAISSHKRPNMGESMQALKKQRDGADKKPKPKSAGPAKDPQSIAAKNRRERISERLKILQDLVPNGSKVDLVTMLEKAISYVKFLQLQVKVLATDEFWPAQGGKAPDISQVKGAIDAILSSQTKDRNSNSGSM